MPCDRHHCQKPSDKVYIKLILYGYMHVLFPLVFCVWKQYHVMRGTQGRHSEVNPPMMPLVFTSDMFCEILASSSSISAQRLQILSGREEIICPQAGWCSRITGQLSEQVWLSNVVRKLIGLHLCKGSA